MILKNTAIVSFTTFLSRIFGYVRDVLIASTLGAGIYNDLIIVALRIPNLFRTIFGEGAFSASFIPIYSGILGSEGKTSALNFARLAQTFLCLAVLIFCTLLYIFMPFLIKLTAPGFKEPAILELAISLSRITTPYLALISIVALQGGVLNSTKHYFPFAAAPIILNLTIIAFVLQVASKDERVFFISYGVLIAGVLELLWMLYFLKKHRLLFFFCRFRMTKELILLIKRMIPAMVGSGVAQINILIDTIIASFIPHGMSYLYYADRIYQLPLALLGTATGIVILPMLASAFKNNDLTKAIAIQNQSIKLLLLFSIPAAFALFLLSFEIVHVLFEHGAFTENSTRETSAALRAFAIGLPAYVLVKIFVANLHAYGDTKTPVKIAAICIFNNAIISLLLLQDYRHVGIAFAASASAWLNVASLYYKLTTSGRFKLGAAIVSNGVKYIISASVMVAGLIFTQHMLHGGNPYFNLLILLISGLFIYAAISLLLEWLYPS